MHLFLLKAYKKWHISYLCQRGTQLLLHFPVCRWQSSAWPCLFVLKCGWGVPKETFFVSHLKKQPRAMPVWCMPGPCLWVTSVSALTSSHCASLSVLVFPTPRLCSVCCECCRSAGWSVRVFDCLLVSEACGRPQTSYRVSMRICSGRASMAHCPGSLVSPLNLELGYSSCSCSDDQKSVCD